MSLRKDGYIGVVVAVVMCDRAPVEQLHLRFGGRFEDGKSKTSTGRSLYRWIIHNAEACEALEVFSKLCLVKSIVASAALPCVKAMFNNPGRQPLSIEEKKARIAAAEFIASINKPVGKRRILDPDSVSAYLRRTKLGGGKSVKLSDGRVFDSISAAARALGVTVSAVGHAKRNKHKVCGLSVEAA